VRKLQKRYFLIALLTGVLTITAVAGYLLPENKEPTPRRVLLDNTGGPVVFQHADHAAKQKIPCRRCHHEQPENSKNALRCNACHGIAMDGSFRKTHADAFQGNDACVTCHHAEFARKDWGHKKHSDEFGVDCRSCHHENADIEPEPQNCASCHDSAAPSDGKTPRDAPPGLADAAHARCASCHEDLFAGGVKSCGTCHDSKNMRDMPLNGAIKLNPLYTNCATCHGLPAEKLIPGRMDAYHTMCMGCHEKLGKGPHGKQQCAQCHTGK
jgi:hypothetical protein